MKLSELRKVTQSLSQLPEPASQSLRLAQMQQPGLDLGNFYQELEMDSPYVDTHQDISYSNANVQFHSHAFYEVLCCRNTCGAEYLMGSERYKLQKGDIIFAPRMSATVPFFRNR